MTRRPAGRHRGPWGPGRAALAPVALVLLVAGCGGGGKPAAPTTSTTALSGSTDTQPTGPPLTLASGGTVTADVPAVPTTLNPGTVAGAVQGTVDVTANILPQTYLISPDLVPVLNTDLISSISIYLQVPAPETVVYQINPRAVWSDGVPISADDFVYAWRSQSGTGHDVDGAADSVASTVGYRDITSVVGSEDGRKVTVSFRTAFADYATLFNNLLPAHVALRAGWNTGFDHFDPATLVSGGPWQVESWTPGAELVLERNPRWWGAPPRLDHVVLKAAADQPATAALPGQAQVAYPAAFTQAMLATVSSSPDLFSRNDVGTTMLQLVFNTRRDPFNSAPLRRAVARSIDRNALVGREVQPLQPNVTPEGSHLYSNAQPGYLDHGGYYNVADPAATARILTTAGFLAGPQGTWLSGTLPLTFQLVWASDDPWSAVTGPIIAAQLVAAGFGVSSDPVPSSQLTGTVLPAGQFDMALVPVGGQAFTSEMARVYTPVDGPPGIGGSLNWGGFDDPAVDTLFDQAAVETNQADAFAIYGQIDRALWDDMATLPLFAEPTLIAWAANLQGVLDDAGGAGPLWDLASWGLLIAAPKATTSTSRAPSGT